MTINLLKKVNKRILVVGDLNSYTNVRMSNYPMSDSALNKFIKALTDLNLIDIFRANNEEKRRYTRWGIDKTLPAIKVIGTRIDHIFASEDIFSKIDNKTTNKNNLFNSDHRMISCELDIGKISQKPKTKKIKKKISTSENLKRTKKNG